MVDGSMEEIVHLTFTKIDVILFLT
jgi:hypothetical protein